MSPSIEGQSEMGDQGEEKALQVLPGVEGAWDKGCGRGRNRAGQQQEGSGVGEGHKGREDLQATTERGGGIGEDGVEGRGE